MGLVDNIERSLEKAVRGVFAAGRSRIEPVDLASRLRAEMDNKAYIVSEGRTLAPNVFTIEFSDADFPRAQDWGQELAEELCDVAIRHARSQGYTLRGAVRVTFTRARTEELKQGEFLILSAQERTDRHAPAPSRDEARPQARKQDPRQAPAPAEDPQTALGQQAVHPPVRAADGAAEPASHPATHWDPPAHPAGAPAADPVRDAAAAAPAAATAASAPSLSGGSSRVAPRVPSRRRTTAPRPASSESAASWPDQDAAPQAAPEPSSLGYKPVLDINGQRFTIQASSIVLGRSSEADITIEDTGVSRRHVEIINQDGVFLAVDLGSTNGSTVDGTPLHGRRELVDGSVIRMGRTAITFRLIAPRSTAWPQN